MFRIRFGGDVSHCSICSAFLVYCSKPVICVRLLGGFKHFENRFDKLSDLIAALPDAPRGDLT